MAYQYPFLSIKLSQHTHQVYLWRHLAIGCNHQIFYPVCDAIGRHTPGNPEAIRYKTGVVLQCAWGRRVK